MLGWDNSYNVVKSEGSGMAVQEGNLVTFVKFKIESSRKQGGR